jgi:hypothetical protein
MLVLLLSHKNIKNNRQRTYCPHYQQRRFMRHETTRVCVYNEQSKKHIETLRNLFNQKPGIFPGYKKLAAVNYRMKILSITFENYFKQNFHRHGVNFNNNIEKFYAYFIQIREDFYKIEKEYYINLSEIQQAIYQEQCARDASFGYIKGVNFIFQLRKKIPNIPLLEYIADMEAFTEKTRVFFYQANSNTTNSHTVVVLPKYVDFAKKLRRETPPVPIKTTPVTTTQKKATGLPLSRKKQTSIKKKIIPENVIEKKPETGFFKQKFQNYMQNWKDFFVKLTLTPEEIVAWRLKPEQKLREKYKELPSEIRNKILKNTSMVGTKKITESWDVAPKDISGNNNLSELL